MKFFIRYFAILTACALLVPTIASAQNDRVFATTFEVIENAITVSPGSVVMTASADMMLTAELRNAAGESISGELLWVSSHPDIVEIDSNGLLQSFSETGSAVITVSAPGATHAQVLVVVAEPEPGALLVSDDEVLSISPPADLEPVGPGTTYDVTLAGTPALELDQAVLGTGEKPVAGRIVTIESDGGNTVATLEVVPMHELFMELDINQSIDLSELPIEFPASITDNFTVIRDASGMIALKRKPSRGPIGTSVFFDFGRDCNTSVAGFEQALSVAPGENFYLTPTLNVDFLYTDQGFQRLVVEGDVQAVFELQPRLRAAITGSIECKLQLGLIRLPVGGAFSLLFSALVPVGAGFSLDATVTTTEEIGYDFTVSAHAQPRVGVACEPECDLVKELNLNPPQSAFRPVIPATLASVEDTLKLAVNAFAFLYADLSFGNPFIEALQFESLSAQAGVRQTLDLEQRDSQLQKPDYASSFALQLVAKIGLGNKIQDLLNALDISFIPTGFEISTPLAQSAHGNLTISGPGGAGSAKAGELVTFAVTLTPPTYVGLDSIGEVEIFRREQTKGGIVLTPAICATINPDSVGTGSCVGVFTEQDVGGHTYVAVYYPQLFGVTIPIPLEIAANSSTGFSVETAIEPEPEVFFGVEVCAEVYDNENNETLVEDCPDYDDEIPAADSAAASAGGATGNTNATASANRVSITSSASTSSNNSAYANGCGGLSAQYATVTSRSITVQPGLSSLSNSSGAYYDVWLRVCASTNAQKGCEEGAEGSITYRGNSSEPGRIAYKDGIFEDFSGGSVTASLGKGNFVSVDFCASSSAEPASGTVNTSGTATLDLN